MGKIKFDESEFSFAVPNFDKKPRKHLNRRGKILVFATLFVTVAIVCTIFFDFHGSFVRRFGSDEDYFAYVCKKNFGNLSDGICEKYEKVLGFLDREGIYEGQICTEISENTTTLLGTASKFINTNSISFEGLENTGILYSVGISDSSLFSNIEICISDISVLTVDILCDENGEVFFTVPEMTDLWVSLGNIDKHFVKTVFCCDELKDALPDRDAFEKILTKWVQKILLCVKEVRKEEVPLTVDELTVNSVRLVTEFDYDKLNSLVEEFFGDAEIKDIGKRVYSVYFGENGGFESFWEKAEKNLYAVLNEFKESNPYIAFFVDEHHEFCGMYLNISEYEISVFSVKDGKKTAQKFSFSSDFDGEIFEISISGEVTDKYNAECLLKFFGKKAFRIKLSDFDKDFSNGLISIIPGSEIAQLINLEGFSNIITSFLKMVSFEGNYKYGDEGLYLKFDVKNGNTIFFSTSFSCENIYNGTADIVLPVNVTNDVNDWIKNLDDEAVVENLEKLALSDDTIEQFSKIIDFLRN